MQSVSEVEKSSHLPFETGRHGWISYQSSVVSRSRLIIKTSLTENRKPKTDDYYIPFKREGTGEPVSGIYELSEPIVFQFPSNGKARVNISSPDIEDRIPQGFQFPSNGKAHVNAQRLHHRGNNKCFNSLQTGRHM